MLLSHGRKCCLTFSFYIKYTLVVYGHMVATQTHALLLIRVFSWRLTSTGEVFLKSLFFSLLFSESFCRGDKVMMEDDKVVIGGGGGGEGRGSPFLHSPEKTLLMVTYFLSSLLFVCFG